MTVFHCRCPFAAPLVLMMLALTACGSGNNGTDAAPGEPDSKPAAADSPVIPEMTGEDGWVELHDMEIPAPGTAVMTIDGNRSDVDIECSGPGVVDNGQNTLFSIRIRGDFELEDGRSGYFELSRAVNRERESFYAYNGQDAASLQVVVDTSKEGRWHSSWQGGPDDDDPEGESLPLLHAQPDGSFTVDSTVEKMHPRFHDEALDGKFTLAGRCPEPWGT